MMYYMNGRMEMEEEQTEGRGVENVTSMCLGDEDGDSGDPRA